MIDDPKIKKRAVNFVLLTVLIYSMGFGIIMPALPSLIMELEGVDKSEAARIGAWIGSAYAIFQFLMGAVVGNFADRFGRRPVFLISLIAFGIDFILMGFAPSIIWLLIGRSIAGGLGAIFGPANAAMADLSTEENRAASFGKVGAAFGLGFIFGPAIGGFLAEYGTRLPFFVAGALAIANFIYGWFVFPETMKPEDKRPFEWRRANPLGALINLGRVRSVLPIAFIYFLWMCATQIYPASWTFFAPLQFGWSQKWVGISLSITGISMVLFQAFVIGKAVTRFGERMTAQMGMMIGTAGLLIYSQLTHPTFALFVPIFMGAQGMAMPALNAMMSRRVPPAQQGELQGFTGSLSALSFLFAQVTFNNVLAAYTAKDTAVYFPGAPFILAAIIAFTAFTALLLLPKAPREAS
jgi:MFS transporter, DHA1 family, tetracycline resistance protein